MKKEDWIDSILESASEIEQAEASPFLYNKINNRLNQKEKSTGILLRRDVGWAVAVSLVVALNVSSLFICKAKIHKQKESASIEALTDEMNSTTNYNY
jgi:hypothetical protein